MQVNMVFKNNNAPIHLAGLTYVILVNATEPKQRSPDLSLGRSHNHCFRRLEPSRDGIHFNQFNPNLVPAFIRLSKQQY